MPYMIFSTFQRSLVARSDRSSDVLLSSAPIPVLFERNMIFSGTFYGRNTSISLFKSSAHVPKLSVPVNQQNK